MADDLQARRLQKPEFEPGSVWLVGAGPGDPGLLTLHAAGALEQAEVVLHDALVAPLILELCSPKARLIAVGKRAGKASPKQLQINQRLIRLARAGHRVVRLKGGDPFVFGRGGEEALALAAAGIPFRVVPGITAGIGGLASAGMPATHREIAQAVTFVTGHGAAGHPPRGVDWAGLAKGSPVLVLYMALRRIEAIAAALMAAGRAPEEPVAFISDASTPEQRTIVTTLGEAAATAALLDAARPTLIVIGPVVELRAVLAPWQQADPMTIASDGVPALPTPDVLVRPALEA
jgi:uroporphyrin-III C-methyltransferase